LKREKLKVFDEFKKVILDNKKIEQEDKLAYIKQLEDLGPDALIAGMDEGRIGQYITHLENKNKLEIEKIKADAPISEEKTGLYERMIEDRDNMFRYVLDTLAGMRPSTTIVPGESPGGRVVVQQGSTERPGGGAATKASNICPNSECAKPVTPDEKFCSHCGAALA